MATIPNGLWQNPFATEWAWLKAHEKLVLILAALLLCGWGYSKYLGFRDASDLRAQALQHEKLQADADKSAALAQQAQQQAAAYKTLADQAQATSAQLMQTLVARDAATRQQQTVDRQLPPDKLAARIVVLAPGGSVAPQSDGSYKVDQPEAESLVNQLDLISPLQQTVKDQVAAAAKLQEALTSAQGLIDTLQAQVSAAQQEFTDTGYAKNKKTGQLECQGGVCKSDIKVAVDNEARKHRKIEVVLAILGYVLGRKF